MCMNVWLYGAQEKNKTKTLGFIQTVVHYFIQFKLEIHSDYM